MRGRLLLATAVWLAAVADASGEGFGAAAAGGHAADPVEVTSLADDGPGSLREALRRASGRTVVFRVSGAIRLAAPVDLRRQERVTVDGASAPAPGITLDGHGLRVWDASDVVVRGLRVRRPVDDGIAIRRARRVRVEHCSLTDAGDENVSVTDDTQDVTVAWSLLGHGAAARNAGRKGMLVASFHDAPVTRVTVHHNLFVDEAQRSPQVSTPGLVDVRNNVIARWRAYGIRLRQGAHGNVVGNTFFPGARRDRALVIAADAGPTWVADNRTVGGADVNGAGTAAAPLAVAPVASEDAAAAAARVFERAGALPRDGVDAGFVRAARTAGAAATAVDN